MPVPFQEKSQLLVKVSTGVQVVTQEGQGLYLPAGISRDGGHRLRRPPQAAFQPLQLPASARRPACFYCFFHPALQGNPLFQPPSFQQVFQERPAVSFPPMVPDRFAGPGIHPQPDRKYDGKQLLRLVFSSKKTVDPGRLRLKTAAAAFPDPEKDRQGHFIRTGVLIDMPKNFQKTSDIAFKILLRV